VRVALIVSCSLWLTAGTSSANNAEVSAKLAFRANETHWYKWQSRSAIPAKPRCCAP